MRPEDRQRCCGWCLVAWKVINTESMMHPLGNRRMGMGQGTWSMDWEAERKERKGKNMRRKEGRKPKIFRTVGSWGPEARGTCTCRGRAPHTCITSIYAAWGCGHIRRRWGVGGPRRGLKRPAAVTHEGKGPVREPVLWHAGARAMKAAAPVAFNAHIPAIGGVEGGGCAGEEGGGGGSTGAEGPTTPPDARPPQRGSLWRTDPKAA
jgi:hypothetical protein